MVYREHRPDASLADLVECYWSLEGSAADQEPEGHRVLPDGCMDLLFDLEGGPGGPLPRVVGAMPRAAVVPHGERVRTWGVRFRPGGARAFLGAPAGELTGRTPPLGAFWGSGASDLWQKLAEAPNRTRRVAALNRALLAHLTPKHTDPVVLRARDALQASLGKVGIADLAAQAGLSTRQLERRFSASVGLPPKLLARILRFRAAVRALTRAPEVEKGRVALRMGYHDQAHFGRDFKALAGVSPSRYLLERQGVAFVQADAPEAPQIGPRTEGRP